MCRVPLLGVLAFTTLMVLSGCTSCVGSCSYEDVPLNLLGPQLGLLMQGNARGVYLAEVRSVVRNDGPLGLLPRRSTTGTFANVTIREVFQQTPPGSPEEDLPLLLYGDTLDVMVSSAEFECTSPDRHLHPGDRIIIFPWRAKGATHPNGTKVPWAWLQSMVLCVDGDTVHVSNKAMYGLQENGTVRLDQFRQALAQPWDFEGAPLSGVPSDAGTNFLAERCAGVTCDGDSRCFFGAGCWSFKQEGPAGCIDGEFFSDGTRCTSGTIQPICD